MLCRASCVNDRGGNLEHAWRKGHVSSPAVLGYIVRRYYLPAGQRLMSSRDSAYITGRKGHDHNVGVFR